MSYKTEIIIPYEALMANIKFPWRQQEFVVARMLAQINLALLRGNSVYVKVRKFGHIRTHGNRKPAYKKNMTLYNKRAWVKKKNEKDFSEKKLLF